MLELPHTLVGVAVASAVRQPVLALPMALGSHFLLDYIPHWDPDIDHPRRGLIVLLAVDSVTALVSGSLIAWHFHSPVMFFSAFFAVLPDLLSMPHFFFGTPDLAKNVLRWQNKYHRNTAVFPGLLTQLAVIVCSLLVIFAHK